MRASATNRDATSSGLDTLRNAPRERGTDRAHDNRADYHFEHQRKRNENLSRRVSTREDELAQYQRPKSHSPSKRESARNLSTDDEQEEHQHSRSFLGSTQQTGRSRVGSKSAESLRESNASRKSRYEDDDVYEENGNVVYDEKHAHPYLDNREEEQEEELTERYERRRILQRPQSARARTSVNLDRESDRARPLEFAYDRARPQSARKFREGSSAFDDSYHPGFEYIGRERRFRITVPQPFSFENRDQVRHKSISRKKFEEWMAEKKVQEEKASNKYWRANPVPSSVIVPRFQSIMAANEARRIEVKRTSQQRLQQLAAPFSFYLRDMNKPPKAEPTYDFDGFKAKPIPWSVSVPLFEKMVHEREIKRKERINKAMQESLRKAKLPPRMELYEKTKGEEKRRRQKEKEGNPLGDEYTFKPLVKSEVPNFDELHNRWDERLSKSKIGKHTVPIEDEKLPLKKYQTTKRDTTRIDFQDDQLPENRWPHVRGPDRYRYTRKDSTASGGGGGGESGGETERGSRRDSQATMSEMSSAPAPTKKVKQAMMKVREEMEKKRMNEIRLKMEEEQRKEKIKRASERVKTSSGIVDRTEELRRSREETVRRAKRDKMQQEKAYQERLQEMYDRVNARPLLVERVDSRQSKAMQRAKALQKIRDRLTSAGLKVERHLNPEELDEVEELEYQNKSMRRRDTTGAGHDDY
eukprot:GILJ01013704.1.p1 GENE.GILJ01013704.1~~GILJ01013704.1.p1  ORF type:complete len:699 (-),score=131.65 GILJ01013704.1:156-2252(-)